PTTVHNKPTTQYPSTPGFISNHWYGRWGQVNTPDDYLDSLKEARIEVEQTLNHINYLIG
ncbi:hypothetical protein, partial [Xanthomonas campestris]|uniref:hypothetical protein n=1 Tax=Xanthomonas campestris TaxID=339 RepID=UPI003D6F0099